MLVNVSVQQYKDNNYDNEVYQQLMREIGDLGYNVPYKEFKEFLDNNIKNNKKVMCLTISLKLLYLVMMLLHLV